MDIKDRATNIRRVLREIGADVEDAVRDAEQVERFTLFIKEAHDTAKEVFSYCETLIALCPDLANDLADPSANSLTMRERKEIWDVVNLCARIRTECEAMYEIVVYLTGEVAVYDGQCDDIQLRAKVSLWQEAETMLMMAKEARELSSFLPDAEEEDVYYNEGETLGNDAVVAWLDDDGRQHTM